MTVAAYTEPDGSAGLGAWAAEARAAAELASSFALTAFVPASLRVNAGREVDRDATVATITAALLAGSEVGLSPMASLRSIIVIQGTPALTAHAARALVLARGHDLWVVESTSTRAIVRGKRRGSPHEQDSVWTLDRARALGLATREQWRRQPGAMLVARATAECARWIAPEALLGMPYVVEEVGDDPDLEGEEPTRAPRKRTARRAARPVVDAPLPPLPTRAEDPAEPHVGITERQLRALHTAMTVAGIVEREDRLAYVSSVIGRDVTTSKDLTAAEAASVLDGLAALVNDETAPPPEDEPPFDDDGGAG